MAPDLIARALEIYNEDKIIPLSCSPKNRYAKHTRNILIKYRYKLEYGSIGPKPDERLWIDPANIDFSIASKHIRDDAPPYGILKGTWDLQKSHWRESIWEGLRERFEEGSNWQDTIYYQTGVDKIESGKSIKRAEGAQTIDEFENYLDDLDDLYEDIKTNGYDRSSVVTVNIGRNGEWMVHHGNHRRAIARIIGVSSIPVRIKYRHKKWQEIRKKANNAGSADAIVDLGDYLSHPDIPEVTSH